jgi:tetratricopeptide (TPR) repeat protein
MDKGREYMQEENELRQVLERYEEMLEKRTSCFFDVQEFELIIDYYLDIRNFRKAYDAVEIAKRQHPGSSEIIIKLIQIYLENGNPSDALEKINELKEWEKENPEVNLLKGTALAQLGKIKEAEKLFDAALEKTEEDKVDILINISIAFENARKYKLAIKYLKSALELEPDNLSVLYDLGFYYERLHNYSASIEFYNKYLDEDPFSDNVWYNLGVVYYKISKPLKALEAYDYTIAMNPSYASAYFNKANLYANDGDYLNAVKVYLEFLDLEPEHIQAWCYLGECYEETDAYEQSLKAYQKVIELDNSFAEGWFGAGVALLAQEKYRDAISYILKAIEFEKDNPEYWFNLALGYEKINSSAEAIKCYNQTILLDSKDEEAWENLAGILLRENLYNSATDVLLRASLENPGNAKFIYYTAACYYLLKDTKKGYEFFLIALKMDKSMLETFYLYYPEGRSDKRIQRIVNLSQ